MRDVFRRLERLETRAMVPRPGPMDFRILLVHPVQGLAGVLVFDSDASRKDPRMPEEVERVRADLESAAGRLICQERATPLTRTIVRRLKQLETRANEVAAARPEPHTLYFISVYKKVVSTHEMAASKWTHFDPPRDRAESSRSSGSNRATIAYRYRDITRPRFHFTTQTECTFHNALFIRNQGKVQATSLDPERSCLQMFPMRGFKISIRVQHCGFIKP